MFDSWNSTAKKYRRAWQRERNNIGRNGGVGGGGGGFGGISVGSFGGGGFGGWAIWEWERRIRVFPEPETAKLWLEQAEYDLKALHILLAQANIEKVSAQVCFLAQQVAEKALKAGMYKTFGLHPTSLKTHALTGHASALQAHLNPGLVGLASQLENYYLKTRYPNVYFPPSVPSTNFELSDALQAEQMAHVIFRMMKDIVN